MTVISKKYFYFRPFEWHHLYSGILFVVLYYLLGGKCDWWHLALLVLGWSMIIDDIGQHYLQGYGNLGKHYHSVYHYAGMPLYILRRRLIERYAWLKWLNKL